MNRSLLFALLLALTASACAAPGGNPSAEPASDPASVSGPGHYARRPAGEALLQRLHEDDGVDIKTARALLADARYQPDIIAKMRKPAEKTLTWARYRPIFVQSERARQGATYIRAHQAIFDRVQQQYGVSANIIAAIIGVETRYGGFIGRDRVLDALATLAFDYPERSTFFTQELGAFIQLCLNEKLNCRKDIGSYAGAMGLPQFMPSSYAAYAVDGNHDGRRDLWAEPADIIASVANYLAEHGWQRDARVALPADLARHNAVGYALATDRTTAYRWDALHKLGIDVAQPPAADTQVGLLDLAGPHGPEYWVALHNFYVITTYNRSPLYAMAVYQLGQIIDASRAPAGPDA